MARNLAGYAPDFHIEPEQRLYLMADGGQIEHLARQLYSLPGELDLEFIYTQAPYEHLLGVSPCVIHATEPVKAWFFAQNDFTAGYFFASRAPLNEIAEAFRRLIQVESPYGSRVFLKMAQSEAAWVLLDTGAAAFWHRLDAAWLPTRQQGWRTLKRPEGLDPQPALPLRITDPQWAALGDINWLNRLEEIEAHLNEWFPACLQASGRNLSWIDGHAETACGKGFTQMQDLLNYFNILAWLGEDAFGDRYPDIRDLIENSSTLTPSQRIEQAAALAERHAQQQHAQQERPA